MRKVSAAVAALLIFSSIAVAQRGEGYDPKDIFGVWERTRQSREIGGNPPPMTPEGEARLNANKPSYGPRAIPPALGNDPMGTCDPLGIPRLLVLENSPGNLDLIETPGRVLQLFERFHVWREIWTDGRGLPADPEPRFMGHSVGRWEGDTFIVDSIGFDERTWLDHFGYPHSDEMRLTERYRRVDADTLELAITISDPKIYTEPWQAETRVLKRNPKPQFEEMFCVPTEEQEFNRRLRDPAGGIVYPGGVNQR